MLIKVTTFFFNSCRRSVSAGNAALDNTEKALDTECFSYFIAENECNVYLAFLVCVFYCIYFATRCLYCVHVVFIRVIFAHTKLSHLSGADTYFTVYLVYTWCLSCVHLLCILCTPGVYLVYLPNFSRLLMTNACFSALCLSAQ